MTNFNTSQNAYGGGAGRYLICEVVNRDDPEQSGRCQVRVIGYQADNALIPNQDLRWARIKAASDNPLHNGIGSAPVGALVGTMFYGFFADGDQAQQLVLDGTMGKPGSEDKNGNLNTKDSDLPPHSRTNAGSGDLRYDSKENKFSDKSVTKYAKDESPNAFGRNISKDADENAENSFSLGMHQYQEV